MLRSLVIAALCASCTALLRPSGQNIHSRAAQRWPGKSAVTVAASPNTMSALFPPQVDVKDALTPPPDDELAMELGTGGLPIGSVADAELAKPYDLIVIGGGPAGVAGALKAAQLGKRTLVVDRPKLAPVEGGLDYGFGGPTGLFSKAMRDVGKTLDIKSLEMMGIDNDVVWRQVRNNCLKLARNNAINCLEILAVFRVGYLQVRTPSPQRVVARALSRH